MSTAEPNVWSPEWPTEPGKYLFYGHRRSKDPSKERLQLRLVTVARGGDDRMHRYTEGEFFYESEQIGFFKKLSEELPTEEQVRELSR